jgi:hypothetical protein
MNRTIVHRAVIALALGASCAAASAALPPFTFDPGAVGLSGGSFTADDVLITDYSTTTISGTSFSETGFLSLSTFDLGGTALTPTGLNSTYGLYIAFSGAGTTTTGNPATTATSGTFKSLTYTLYGYNGAATFGITGNVPTTSAASPIDLGSGSLIQGTVLTAPAPGGFVPAAFATLTFTPNTANAGFFAAPSPFYSSALSSFLDFGQGEVQPFVGGFNVSGGGGSFNFVSSVPEPQTYELMFGGLALMAFVASRRSQNR